MRRVDDDLKLRPAMHVVDLDQLDQPGFLPVVFHHKAPLGLIVDVLIIQVRKLHKRFVRLFKPVAHHAGIVIQLMDKVQIFPLQRT